MTLYLRDFNAIRVHSNIRCLQSFERKHKGLRKPNVPERFIPLHICIYITIYKYTESFSLLKVQVFNTFCKGMVIFLYLNQTQRDSFVLHENKRFSSIV